MSEHGPDEILPDEEKVIEERMEDLENPDDCEFLTTEEIRENLDL